MNQTTRLGAAERLFAACGVWMVGLGCYFIFVRPALLAEDLRYAVTSLAVLQASAPRIEQWLSLVFKVMGGFMVGAGVLVTYFALHVLPRRPAGALAMMVLVGAVTLGLMSAVNFALASDFRWILLGPLAVWFAGALAYSRGEALTNAFPNEDSRG